MNRRVEQNLDMAIASGSFAVISMFTTVDTAWLVSATIAWLVLAYIRYDHEDARARA